MKDHYLATASIFKALSDVNRLMIIDMLTEGELCACKILERFQITQPTLSHHMKILCECGLVNARREGKWMHYSLNQNQLMETSDFLSTMSRVKESGCTDIDSCK